MTQQTTENLKKTFILGFIGIWKTSEIGKKLFCTFIGIATIILSLVLPEICIMLKINLFEFIVEVKNIMVNFLPCILGFTIAGYTLVVGFVQSNMLDKITEPAKDSDFSLYQKMSGTFAINVISQAIALIVAFIYHFFIFIDKHKTVKNLNISDEIIGKINYGGLSLILFFFIISTLLTVQIVLNIFEFSQLHHFVIVNEKIKLDMKSDGRKKGNIEE